MMSKLHVSKFGRAYNAPVLALLHGWGSSSKIWQPCIEKLAEGFQVWCIDLPGHGESQAVEWDESVAQGVELLAKTLPERCCLVGWSLGGLFAQLYVKQHPQRVQSLMLIASTPKFIAGLDWPHAMPKDIFAKFSEQFNASPKAILKQFTALQALHSVSSKEIMRVLEQAASDQYLERIAWGLQWLQELDLRNSCVVKDIPLQLLQGENDQVLSIKAAVQTIEIWQPSHKNLQLCIIADAGHTPFLSHPERFHQQVHLMFAQSIMSHVE
jgi:pimeloyl-[acyl-carrier protein] methyl ester esterase